MKFLAFAALSLFLAGCLEAADLMAGGVRQTTQYCQAPNGVVLCDHAKPKPAP